MPVRPPSVAKIKRTYGYLAAFRRPRRNIIGVHAFVDSMGSERLENVVVWHEESTTICLLKFQNNEPAGRPRGGKCNNTMAKSLPMATGTS